MMDWEEGNVIHSITSNTEREGRKRLICVMKKRDD